MSTLTFKTKGSNTSATKLVTQSRNFTLTVDEPQELGGENEGANPVEYLLAGYAGCINVVGNIVAKELGIKLTKLDIEIEGSLDPSRFLGHKTDERAGFNQITVILSPEVDQPEKLNEWLKQVEYRCPVNDNLSNPTPIEIKVNQLAVQN